MDAPGRADPFLYPGLRRQALSLRLPDLPPGKVQAVLMDWHIASGFVSVLAATDGTASLYLSSGGGYIGGGQRYPALREAALRAVTLADQARSEFQAASTTDLPPAGMIFFYLTMGAGLFVASAEEGALRAGHHALARLGLAMQGIISEYRQTQPAI